jgi:hypothetical protein
MAELGEFCFVSYHPILDSNLFTCRLNDLVRREVYGVPFFRISSFFLCCGHTLDMAELGEFCFISYHPILDSNLFTCRLNGLVRREAHGMPFLPISMFSLCSIYLIPLPLLFGSSFCLEIAASY